MRKTFFGGFTLVEISVVATIVSVLGAGTYLGVQKGRERECISNLKQIHAALVMFEADNGVLPDAKFFPSSVSDARGIHYILVQYGVSRVMFCPSLPSQLNSYGTNYIWNDTVNRKSIDSLPSGTWLMTEMTAVSKNIGSPHMAGYSVLYVEGNAQISPRVEFPDVPESASESKPELKKPSEVPVAAGQEQPGFRVTAPSEVTVGEDVRISVFSRGAGNVPAGVLRITCSPAERNEVPGTVESKGDSREVVFNAVFLRAGKTVIRVTDEATGTEGILEIFVSPGEFYEADFQDFPAMWEAGKAQKFRIILLDREKNKVDYSGEIVISSSSNELPARSVVVKNGVWEGMMTVNGVSEGNVLYVAGKSKVSASTPFAVKHSSPSFVDIISDSEAVAGKSYEIAVKVKDAYGNVCSDYNGEFDIVLSQGAVSTDKKIIIRPEDRGMKKNELTFFKSGDAKIQVSNNDLKGAREVYVNPGVLSEFSIREIKEQEAGKPFDILVRAMDKFGNQVKGYYLRDAGAIKEYVNRDSTAGVWMETIVINKSGEHTIVVEDADGRKGRSNAFVVKPSAPVKMEICGIPASIAKEKECTGTVMLKDAFGNEISGYAGELVLEKTEGLQISVSAADSGTLQIKVIAGKTGCHKLVVRDRNNKELSAEQVLFVTEAK